ncbi:MAG: HPr(Ser) kinase/phosphatase [Deltaproteobacteria bacterium]|nr:HPr(Ser) kinase/phosphatase [Deltaproteobacteria bacterium]
MTKFTVEKLLTSDTKWGLNLKLVCGEKHLGNQIADTRIQKPGLLLTGLPEELHSDRIQILGGAEIGYLATLPENDLKLSLAKIKKADIPCLIVTRGMNVPPFLITLAEEKGIPIFATSHTSSHLIDGLIKCLEDSLAPTTTIHGVLIGVQGVGVLIIGKSGIGKSECALDLILRGHRLVADDVVIVKKMPRDTLYGTPAEILKYHMEIRGLGILNIKDLFGITAIREVKRVDIVVEMVQWAPDGSYERLGFDEDTYSILDVELPHITIPVSPGRSVADLVEVAARNRILKFMGYNPSLAFQKKLQDIMYKSMSEPAE